MLVLTVKQSPKPTSHRTLYLIDGSAYVYRAFFALPALTNSKGLQTNAVYGFTTMLLKILRQHQPEALAVAFDEKGPTLRHEEFKEYKAHRPEMPEGMQTQIPYIHRVVEAFGIPALRVPGYEADDLIGTVARKAEAMGYEVVIVTGDKDMFQLLTPAVRIYDPVKDKWFGEAECYERFGVEPARVVEVMGLMGDATDNIPGVKGIGEKTAIKLITQFGTIDELLQRVDEVSASKTRSLLTEQADAARLSRRLATIQVESPVEFDPVQFRVDTPPAEPLVSLFRDLEFPTLLKAVGATTAGEDGPAIHVQTIRDEAAAQRFADEAADQKLLGLHGVLGSPTEGKDGETQFSGLALSLPNGTTGYATQLFPSVRKVLQSPTVVKAIHDLKPLLLALSKEEQGIKAPWFDTMIAAYLLNPNRRAHTLDAVVLDILGHRMAEDQSPEPAEAPNDLFDHSARPAASQAVQASVMAQAGQAAAVVLRLAPALRERLVAQGSFRLFEDVEMPLVPVLAEVERHGFRLDVAALQSLSEELERELDRMLETITRLAGQEFNLNSPKQLASILFDNLGLKPIRKTKTGYSTDEDTLTQLALEHELPAQILNYRSLSKLKSTYVDSLPTLVSSAGRLHTSLNQTVTATGRLSSSEPNLQNIPVKGEYGLRIREAFVAPAGYLLLSADYSQIEPRILAHLSQDERLLKVFEQGEDIHMSTAVDIFNLVPDQITKEMRRVAKTVVFGILYGISPFGLASTLGVSQQDAKKYIDTYFERYAGVKTFLDQTIEEAKQRGYVTTILGRRRPIPELASNDPTQRGFGERMAVNSPIQGSAADLIKMAMIAVSRRLHEELPKTKMILQVHDELIFETPEKDLTQAKELVRAEMEAAGPRLGLSVPLKVDAGVGRNWREAHP